VIVILSPNLKLGLTKAHSIRPNANQIGSHSRPLQTTAQMFSNTSLADHVIVIIMTAFCGATD